MSENNRVAAHPVVAIEVREDEVRLNGDVVEHAPGVDLYMAAVHAVAELVCQPLGRPVRVVAADETGETHLVVHPNGATTDFRTGGVGQPDELGEEVATLEEMLSGPLAPDDVAQPRVEDPLPSSTESADIGAQIRLDPEPSTDPDAQAARTPRSSVSVQERPSFITAGRAVQPAAQGWRGIANGMGLRLQPGQQEQKYRADVAAVSRHWPGTRTVAIVNPKGSASKTPTSACLSAVFARLGGAGVMAWDNNETEGTLRFRTEWAPHEASLLHVLPKVEQLLAPAAGVAELSNYVHHQPADRYDVLWSDPTIDGEHVVSAKDVQIVHQVASRYYRMVVMDSGNNSRAQNWRAMIDQADAIVIPCTEVEDTAEVGARLLETLRKRGGHSEYLADNALVVASQRTKRGEEMDRIARDFAGLARSVVRIPYDQGLKTGVIRFDALRPGTQRAWLAAAASLTEAL